MKAHTLLILGILLGLVGGVGSLWAAAPKAPAPSYPPLMGAEYREDWIRMTALAYALEGNLQRTETRLRDLPTSEIQTILRQTLEHAIAEGQALQVVKSLAQLARAYQVEGPSVDIYTSEDATAPPPTATSTPAPTATLVPTVSATPTPRPTRKPPTPSPTPTTVVLPDQLPHRVISQTLTCSSTPTIAVSLVVTHTVQVRGKDVVELKGLPARQIWLIWEDGADRAFTGLRPEHGLGYADFEVAPGYTYNLYIDVARGAPVLTIQVEPCTEQEGGGWISRALTVLERSD